MRERFALRLWGSSSWVLLENVVGLLGFSGAGREMKPHYLRRNCKWSRDKERCLVTRTYFAEKNEEGEDGPFDALLVMTDVKIAYNVLP